MAVTREQVAQIYVATFNRAPLSEGLDYWTSSDFTIEQVATSFFDQDEAQAIYTDGGVPISSEEFVLRIFDNLFNRLPLAAGLDYWTEALDNETVSQAEMILAVANGATDPDDMAILANKTEAGMHYADNGGERTDYYLDGIDETQASLDDVIADMDAELTPSMDGSFTADTDSLEGGAGYDSFEAPIVQNPWAGGVSNSLSSADRLDGGGGIDTLHAELVPEFFGVTGDNQIDVQPRTTSIENVTFEAREINFDTVGNTPGVITVDAKYMNGVDKIGSKSSDGDLIIENLTTLNGTDIRHTSEMTITMDHTDNFNSDEDASDLTVLFDEDYLNTTTKTSGSSLTLKISNVLNMENNANPVEGFDEVNFSVGTIPVQVDVSGSTSYEQIKDKINDRLTELKLDTTVSAELGTPEDAGWSQTTTIDGVTYDFGKVAGQLDPIIITNTGSEKLVKGEVIVAEGGDEGDINKSWQDTDAKDTTLPISINVELDKVGRDGEGGNLVIGGKELDNDDSQAVGDTSTNKGDGINTFDIVVKGDEDRPSNLGVIMSTNGALETVNIASEANTADDATFASLTVRGEETANNSNVPAGTTPFGGTLTTLDADAFLGDLAIGEDTAALNIDTFTAQGGGDVTLYADYFDPETGVNNDWQTAWSVTTGVGDDTLVLDIDGDTVDAKGESFAVSTGAGDDDITVDVDAFVSQGTMAELENLSIDSGAGNDEINLMNIGNWDVNAGSGDDTVYVANNGNDTARNTVTEVQTITFGNAGDLATQSQVTVNLSDGQSFTTANTTVVAQAQIDTYTPAGGADGVLEVGDAYIFTINGVNVTYTSDGTHTGAEMATAINSNVTIASQVTAADNGSGGVTITADVPGTPFTSSVTEIADADGTDSVTGGTTTANIAASGGNYLINTGDIASTVATNVANVINETAVNVTATTNGADVILTYGAAYAPAGAEDIAPATVVGLSTDSAVTIATTTGGTDGTDAVDVTTEVAMIQLAADPGADLTISFSNGDGAGNNVDITVVDTDGNTELSLVELTDQIAAQAGLLTGWTLTDYNASLGRMLFTSNTAGAVDDLITPAGEAAFTSYTNAGAVTINTLNDYTTVDGAAATPFVAGANGEVQTITVDNGADETGDVFIQIDLDSDGVFAADGSEDFTVGITEGNEGSVAGQLATYINALTGVSAAQGAGANIDDVIITWDVKAETTDNGSATQNALQSTFVDGAVKGANVTSVDGLEATTAQPATWLVNYNGTDIVNNDHTDDTTDATPMDAGDLALLFGATLTVTYSGASTNGASGVIAGAAVATDNGYESTVTIDTDNYVGNFVNINDAIMAAIQTDDDVNGGESGANVLEELLTVRESNLEGLIITSVIDGEFNEADLAITMTAADVENMTTSQKAGLVAALQGLDGDSDATYTDAVIQDRLEAAVDAFTTSNALDNLAMATSDGTTLLAGAAGTTENDSTIELGIDDDVIVLSTNGASNNTLVYENFDNGHDTVVNFTETGLSMDMIDFSAYLDAQTSASGSEVTAVDYAQTLNTDTTANLDEVTIINDFEQYLGDLTTNSDDETWVGLDADKLLAALHNDNDDADDAWGNIQEGDLDVASITDLVGETYNHIVMVENDLNDGEYKVFNLVAEDATDNADADFMTPQLIGIVDFGDTLANLTDANFA